MVDYEDVLKERWVVGRVTKGIPSIKLGLLFIYSVSDVTRVKCLLS